LTIGWFIERQSERGLAQVADVEGKNTSIQTRSAAVASRTDLDLNHSEFINRLKSAIGDTSVRQFAAKAGLSAQTVTNVLNGSEPTRPTLLAIAIGSGVSIDWLVRGNLETSNEAAQDVGDDDLGLAMSCFVAVTELLQETGRETSFDKTKALAINMFRREKERRSGQEPGMPNRGSVGSNETRA
jgi:transcriptional regulator with XRE-family HTH domain